MEKYLGFIKAFITIGVIVFLAFAVHDCANQDKNTDISITKDSTYHAKIDSLNLIASNIPMYYTDSARSEVLRNYSKYR